MYSKKSLYPWATMALDEDGHRYDLMWLLVDRWAPRFVFSEKPKGRLETTGTGTVWYLLTIWVFPKIGGKPPKWMDYNGSNPIKMDDLGVPLFLETSIFLGIVLSGLRP